MQAGIYFSLFQLFSGFVRGDVFTLTAALRIRRAGLFDMAYIVASPLRDFLAMALLTAHLPEGAHWVWPSFGIDALYDFVVGGTGVALGQVFGAAARIAKENAEIV